MSRYPLHELLDLSDSGVWGDEDTEGGVSILRSTNFNADGRLDFSNLSFRAIEAKKRDSKLLQEGDILLEKSGGGPKQPVGRVCLYRGHELQHSFGNFIARLRPKKSLVLSEYLFYFLWHFHSIGKTSHYQKQTTGIRNLEYKRFLSIEVPVPSLAVQSRVVDILSRAESIIRLRREAQQKAAELVPSIFLDMFGDPATNPKGLQTTRIENLCTLVRGSSPRPQGDPQFFGGPVPRLMIADITRDGVYVTPRIDSLTELGATKSRSMKAGDVVMAVSGAVGLPAILAVDACIHDGFVGFRDLDPSVSPEFFYSYLSVMRQRSASQAVGATFQNLKTDQVKEWLVPIPSPGQQKSFLDVVARARSINAQQEESTRRADDTLSAFLGRTFNM